MAEAMDGSPGRSATAASAAWAASIGKGLARGRDGLGLAARASASVSDAARDGPVEHPVARLAGDRRVKRSGRRVSGDCGRATSSAASAKESRFGSLPK